MKFFVITLLASSSVCLADTSTFMKEGFSELQGSIKSSFQTQLNSSADCPAGGSQVFENLVEKKAGVMSAPAVVQGVIKQTDAKATEVRGENAKCGVCKQLNVVSQYAAVNPEKIEADSYCDNRPTKTFTGTFNSTQAIQSYTQAVLQGNNEDGEILLEGCPDPCAYYITTAQTPVEAGKTHLTLTVQCGQPRRDSIFSAQYSFKAGLVHNWSCAK